MNSALEKLKDISFIDNRTLDSVLDQLVSDYEKKMEELGEPVKLDVATKDKAILNAFATQIFQCFKCVDNAGKLNLLKYTFGDFLDNIASLKKVTRNEASKAVTTIRFSLEEARMSVVSIPTNTRVSNGNGIIFQTDSYAEIPIGDTYIDVKATCDTAGIIGNDLPIGALNVMVDPVAYISEVSNIDITSGGSDKESDDDLKDRTYLAPSSYSTAGTGDGYKYWCKSFSSSIGDVRVASDNTAGTVDIYFLLVDGTLPSVTLIAALQAFITDKNIKPMTDLVTCHAPTEVEYNIEFTYYINSSDRSQVEDIKAKVAQAVADYVAWQREIGKDINPDELMRRVINAGAKRMTITSPVYTEIDNDEVPKLGTSEVTYGGLEDD